VTNAAPVRIGVDVGGTFTDVVVASDDGEAAVGKALTTHDHLVTGILAGLSVAAEQMKVDVHELLRQAAVFIYGTTHATNAILERRTARTALFVTAGFPDILVRREGTKNNPYDLTEPYPRPFVPRHLTFEIPERTSAEGDIIVPLDQPKTREIVRGLRPLGIEAIAVSLLWSISNPAHELAVAQIVSEELPGIPYSLSHSVNPIIREFRRTSSTAIDASLKPLMGRHLHSITTEIAAAGFDGEMLAATSLGGVMSVDDLAERPIHSVKSGPSLGPVAGSAYAEAEGETSDLIVCDTGGTSFDVSLIRDGRIIFTRETWLGGRLTGHLTGLSSCDVRSVGAGGGSIAWLDTGGLLRVGPQSAGADPGPACYGRGGTHATVTDAAAVLGYLRPDGFLGGRMRLDQEAARQAVDDVAKNLGTSTEATAAAILAVANEHMVEAIKELTINEGVDPREGLIVAGGGAAGLNIVPIARELGCTKILIPRLAGVLSASGALLSDIVAEFSTSKITATNDFDFASINLVLDDLDDSMSQFETMQRVRGAMTFRREYFVEARYQHQVWELEIPLARNRFDNSNDVEQLLNDFHAMHERVFAVKDPGAVLECIHWKGRLRASLATPSFADGRRNGTRAVSPPRRRNVIFRAEDGSLIEYDTSIFTRAEVTVGRRVDGPAIIEEPTTTIVLYPGSAASVTTYGSYLIRVDQAA
jgi:N-methylhydantoinase A